MTHIFNQLSGYIGWKDKNLKHLGCNQNLAHVLKLSHSEDIIGLSDACLQPHDEEVIQFHRKNDEIALSGKVVRAIHRSTQPYDGSYFYFVKKPLFNENNEIHGIIYHCLEFSHFEFQKTEEKYFFKNVLPSYYYLDAHHNPYQLSKRELETLFFLLRGHTAKQIADALQLSKRTIETYIEQMKNKLGCQNKAELLYLAMINGYLNFIPPKNKFLNDLLISPF